MDQPFTSALEILAKPENEHYIALNPAEEDQERLNKFMMELLSEKPLFPEDSRPINEPAKVEEKVQYWRNDRYKLYKPIYDISWSNQDLIGDLDDLCEAI